MSVIKTRMLRLMCDNAKKDRIRNEVIQKKVAITPIKDKLRE